MNDSLESVVVVFPVDIVDSGIFDWYPKTYSHRPLLLTIRTIYQHRQSFTDTLFIDLPTIQQNIGFVNETMID